MLSDIEVTEISVVDRPANPHAKIAFYKRGAAMPRKRKRNEEDEMSEETDGLPVVVGKYVDTLEAENERLLKLLKNAGFDEDGEPLDDDEEDEDDDDGDDEPDSVDDESDSDDDSEDDEDDGVAKMGGFGHMYGKKKKKKMAEEGVMKSDQMAEILKNADPSVVTLMKAFADDNQRLRKEFETEREARMDQERRQRASAEFGHLGSEENVAEVLKSIEGTDGESQVISLLKHAEGMAADANWFNEVGMNTPEGSTASKIEKRAEEIQKADGELTEEQAFVKALEANPNLYHDHVLKGE